MSAVEALSQYMTPDWAAIELVDRYFPHEEGYIEPSCGRGAFLRAFPAGVPGAGVEIDPVLAIAARESTNRPVVVGDFRTVDLPLPFRATAIVGNPPFKRNPWRCGDARPDLSRGRRSSADTEQVLAAEDPADLAAHRCLHSPRHLVPAATIFIR